MADDWRATVFTGDSDDVADVVAHICSQEVPDEVRNRLGDDVAVSPGAASVFLYADSGEVAREAGQIAQEVFSRHDLPAELIVDRWYGADPLRSLPEPQQRRIHHAVILGRPVPPHQAAVAAGHARHLRWVSVVGGIIAVIGAAMLLVTAFAPHATWSMWLTPATFLLWGAIFLFFGFNARRAAQVYHHPGS